MSKYDEQFGDDFSICPYCKNKYQVEYEDYSDSERVEECEACGKKFYTWQEFTVETRTKPDCKINNEEHKWGEPTTLKDGTLCYCCTDCVGYKFDRTNRVKE